MKSEKITPPVTTAEESIAKRFLRLLAGIPLPVLVTLVLLIVYSYRPLIQSSMDNQPLRWGAMLLATRGTLDFSVMGLDPSNFYSFRTHPDGSITSHTPVGTAFLGAPFFWMARQLGVEFSDGNVVLIDAVAASFLTALAAGMLAWLVRRQGKRSALFLGLALGLATASWATASRCLWQHTGAQFSLLLALCLLGVDKRRVWHVLAAAGAFALTVWCRPFLAPACAILFVGLVADNRKALLWGGAVAVLAAAGWFTFNYVTTQSWTGTYVTLSVFRTRRVSDYLINLWGSLFSANRGMFVFSPLLLLGVPVMLRSGFCWKKHRWQAVLTLAIVVQLLLRGMTPGWFGGHCYGSRYMLDVAALMLLVSAPLVTKLLAPPWWKALLPLSLFVVSASIQFLGVTRDYESWNILMRMNVADNAWNWKQSQIAHCLTYGESTRGPLQDPMAYVVPMDGVIDLKDSAKQHHMRYGFTHLEPWGPWAVPPRAAVAVTLPASVALRVRPEAVSESYPLDPTVAELYWNGRKFGELAFTKREMEFEKNPWFDVPAHMVQAGVNYFEFRISRAYYKGCSPTPLGVAFNRIVILPAPASGQKGAEKAKVALQR